MNTPIYRAKKIDSDKYIQGYLLGMWGEYFISWGETNHVPNKVQIDPLTLAVHFKDMLDSEGTKIFASLSDNGKGGDIVEFEHIRYLEDDESSYMIKGLCLFMESSFLVDDIDNKFDRVFYDEEGRNFRNEELKVIGIHK